MHRRVNLSICLLVSGFLLFSSSHLRADASPEFYQLLTEINGQLKTFVPTRGPQCTADLVDKAQNALQGELFSTAFNAVVVKPLETGAKAAAGMLGVPAAAITTYSVMRCAMDETSASGFAQCVTGEAIGYASGAGMGAAGVDDISSTLAGVAWDDAYGRARGAYNSYQAGNEVVEGSSESACNVRYRASWFKRRAGTSRGGQILVQVWVEDCDCRSASDAESGYLSVFFDVNYSPAGSNQPGWRVGTFERLHVEAQCCGQSSRARDRVYLFSPQGLLVRDNTPVAETPAPTTGGAGAALDAALENDSPASSTTPEPDVPEPVYLPQPEKEVYTFDEPCPACLPVKQAMEEAVREWSDLREERNRKYNEKAVKQGEINRTQRRIDYLQSRLRGERGIGGESYDPGTGLTTRAYDTGDGRVRITVEDSDGNVLSERFRERESTADIQQELSSRQQDLVRLQQELQDIIRAIVQVGDQISETSARIDNLGAALRDCIERLCGSYADCKQLLEHIQNYRDAGLDTGVSRDVVNRLVRQAREMGCFDIDTALDERMAELYDLTGIGIFQPSVLDELEDAPAESATQGSTGTSGANSATPASPVPMTGAGGTGVPLTGSNGGGNISPATDPAGSTGEGAGPVADNTEAEVPEPIPYQEVIPAANSDLQTIMEHANRIAATAGTCVEFECPVLDCGVANALLLGLINAEANLDKMLGWLNGASDDAMAHLLSLNADGILTGEMLAQAQDAQAVHQYLHRIGSLLLDLAALKDFYNNFRDGSFAEGSLGERLDGTYEMLKDLESAVGTAGEAYGVKTPAPVSNVPGAAVGAMGGDAIADAMGAPNATPEQIGSAINDLKSQINDAIQMVQEAKEGKTPTAAVGRAIGRIVKTISTGKMQQRERLMEEYMVNLDKSASAIASSMQFLQRVNSRRFAAEDALKAVRSAKDALMACVAKACGAMSLVRPAVSNNFDGWGSALRYFNTQLPSILVAISQALEVKNQCPVDGKPLISIGGGSTGGNLITTGTPLPPPSNRIEAACPECQAIADQIGRIIDEVDYWRGELERVEELLRQAETIHERIRLLESQKADNRRAISELNRAIAEAEVFGMNVGPGLSIQLTEAEARARDLQRQITARTRELDRLESDKDKLPEIRERISSLNQTRRELRASLQECEQNMCSLADQAKLLGDILTDVEVIDVRNITGNDPFDARDPLAPEASEIGLQQSDSGSDIVTGGTSGGGTSTGGGTTSGGGTSTGGGTTSGGGTTPLPIMVSLSPASVLDRHIVGTSSCPDNMGTVLLSLSSGNPFSISDLQATGVINGFVVTDAPGVTSPSASHNIGIQFNCASPMTTVRSGNVTGTVTDSVTGQTSTFSIPVTNEVTSLINALPSGSTYIPTSKVFLAGPDACPLSHYHGGPAIACDGTSKVDPAPTVCGYGTVNDVVQIHELDCANP